MLVISFGDGWKTDNKLNLVQRQILLVVGVYSNGSGHSEVFISMYLMGHENEGSVALQGQEYARNTMSNAGESYNLEWNIVHSSSSLRKFWPKCLSKDLFITERLLT